MQTVRLKKLIYLSDKSNLDYFFIEGYPLKSIDLLEAKKVIKQLGYGLEIYFQYLLLTQNLKNPYLFFSKIELGKVNSLNYKKIISNDAIDIWENRKRIVLKRKIDNFELIRADINLIKRLAKRFSKSYENQINEILRHLFEPLLSTKKCIEKLSALGKIKKSDKQIKVSKFASKSKFGYYHNPLHNNANEKLTELKKALKENDEKSVIEKLKLFSINIDSVSHNDDNTYKNDNNKFNSNQLKSSKNLSSLPLKSLIKSSTIPTPSQIELALWIDSNLYKQDNNHWIELLLWSISVITLTAFFTINYNSNEYPMQLTITLLLIGLLLLAYSMIYTKKC